MKPDLPSDFVEVTGDPPGVGRVRWTGARPPRGDDHSRGFGAALDQALFNIGRSPGDYSVRVDFSLDVRVENPGTVIEYIAELS
jgi:hypothetical protein